IAMVTTVICVEDDLGRGALPVVGNVEEIFIGGEKRQLAALPLLDSFPHDDPPVLSLAGQWLILAVSNLFPFEPFVLVLALVDDLVLHALPPLARRGFHFVSRWPIQARPR